MTSEFVQAGLICTLLITIFIPRGPRLTCTLNKFYILDMLSGILSYLIKNNVFRNPFVSLAVLYGSFYLFIINVVLSISHQPRTAI